MLNRILIATAVASAAWAFGDLQKANAYLDEALRTQEVSVRIELLRKSINEQVSFAGHYQLGKAYRDAKRHQEAMRAFRAALDLCRPWQKEDRAHAYYQMGRTLSDEGRGYEALPYLRQSLDLEKNRLVERTLLDLEKELAARVQPAVELERALALVSRDLMLTDGPEGSAGGSGVPVWIHFDFDRADLTPEGVRQARELGEAMRSEQLASFRFLLVGHTDLIGSADYNLALSKRRAETVAQFLIREFRIPADRVTPQGRGMVEPLVESGSAQEQAVNRRVEIVLAK